ncbi:hypothetical protein OCE25_26475 [Bacillus cereus]|nr:hypothetical protein [Bacillus cereus]
MIKKTHWTDLIGLVGLTTLGALLANYAKLIPNNIISWVIISIAIIITFGASFTGLFLLRKNKL